MRCKQCKHKFKPNDLYKNICGPYCREIYNNVQANLKWVAQCPSKKRKKRRKPVRSSIFNIEQERNNRLDKLSQRSIISYNDQWEPASTELWSS